MLKKSRYCGGSMGSRMLNHVSLFAGLGGFIAAANRRDIQTIFATDFEAHCIKTIQNSFPDVPVACENIMDLDFSEHFNIETQIDILSAGFPCQSFSTAGANLGFDDPRGKLFFEIPRLIESLVNPPKVVLLENVPHLKMFDNGSRLSRVIQELRMSGYWVSSAQSLILNSRDICGSPQRRERLYIIAYHSEYFKKNFFNFNGFKSVDAQDLWSLLDTNIKQDDKLYLEEDNKYYLMLKQSIRKHNSQLLYQIRRVGVRVCPENICPTLTANMGGGGHNVPFLQDDWGIRKLSISECLRLQGYRPGEILFPNDIPNNRKYMMIGNAIHAGTVESVLQNIDLTQERSKQNDRMELSA